MADEETLHLHGGDLDHWPTEPGATDDMAAAIGPITESLISWAEQPRPRPHPMVGAYCRVLDTLTRPPRVEP